MTDRGPINPGIRLDIQQLQLEAQHRWLRPAEICEILRNYDRFQISAEPPNKPPSGSLFLFDRKVLRYFRKDNHNWRKKKDGKTVKEAHEKLKVGSIDVLHCYYAHGEDNESFQRRSYWLLEEEYMHIVFVHYLEVKGNKSCFREAEARMSYSPLSTSLSSGYANSLNESYPVNGGSPSPTSSLTSSAFEEVESEDNQQAMSKFPAFSKFMQTGDGIQNGKVTAVLLSSETPLSADDYSGDQLLVSGVGYNIMENGQGSKGSGAAQSKILDLPSWEEIEQSTRGSEAKASYPSFPSTTGSRFSDLSGGSFTTSAAVGTSVDDAWQDDQLDLSGAEFQDIIGGQLGENAKYYSNKQGALGNLRSQESLQKVDSFNKWMTKELGEVGELQLKSSSSIAWCNVESDGAVDDSTISNELQLDNYSLGPSISQDQLFSIFDISPSWGYSDSATKVIVFGNFLRSRPEKYNLSCMFGEVEVPAIILNDGTGLSCCAPARSLGRVPFYVTCSNRLACSEVREFEYKLNPESVLLHQRLDKLLSVRSFGNQDSNSDNLCEKLDMISKITLLLEHEQNPKVLEITLENGSDPGKLLKEKLYSWLLDKVNEDGKGPNVLDEEGQGVIHLAAALGYDWVIEPTIAAGVNVNFRDVNGWTALHWAAFHGREKTVAFLVLCGASSGAVTDPSPEFPRGRTAADLASANGFKGISGFLAESFLTTHLDSLKMTDGSVDQSAEASTISEVIQSISDRTATPGNEFDSSAAEALSMKDSLAAVLNATQAHGRIHQVFRMQSFQRKKMDQYVEDDASGIINERIVSLMPSRMQRSGRAEDQHVHSAALQIQKKFRGWTKRKEFLNFRQRVVKIQAHVRGHQVRKRYKTVIWSVGILEKVILRWRRKGSGLRGFRSGAPQPISCDPAPQVTPLPSADDDYDFLKEGRKQAEERLQKALVRVKSMVQYPDARAQYRRLLTAVEDMQKNQQQRNNGHMYSPGGTSYDGEEDMVDVERLLIDDDFMSAFDGA